MRFNFPLHKAIREKNLTQREFAKLVGDHPTFVSRVMNGWYNLDDARKLKYARILGQKPEELFQD